MVEIYYNGKNAFSGLGPTPFVGVSQEFIDFGKKWNQVTNLTLEGQISGKYIGGENSFYYLNEAKDKLLDNFRQNFKTLEIRESGVPIYTGYNTIIKSINFEESKWYALTPYSIDISIYDQKLFSESFGVMNPVDEISFSEDSDDITNYTRKISADGIVTQSKNGIQNAKEWVTQRKALPTINPILVKNNSNAFLLQTETETIDRFNNTYSWEGTYKKSINKENPSNSILSYTLDISSNTEDNFVSVTINGTLSSNNITNLRSDFNKLNLFNICNNASINIFKKVLSNRFLSQEVTESPHINQLSFSASFNDDFSTEIDNDLEITIDQDVLKCTTNVTVSANITCKYGNIVTRWQKVQDYFRQTFKPFSFASDEYTKEVGSTNTLLNKALNESITYDQYNATISYKVEYSDKKTALHPDALSLTSNVSYIPAVTIHTPLTSAFLAREHNVQNLGTSPRSKITSSVSIVGKPSAQINTLLTIVQQEVSRVISQYTSLGLNPVLENQNKTISNETKTVSIDETWSFQGPITPLT
jgi:hypothetical protein